MATLTGQAILSGVLSRLQVSLSPLMERLIAARLQAAIEAGTASDLQIAVVLASNVLVREAVPEGESVLAFISDTVGSVRLEIEQTPPPDDHGDDLLSASPFSGAQMTGELEVAGDIDMFRISLEAGRSYQFDLTSSDFDPLLRLYDANGTLLMANDDALGLNAQLTFTPSQAGDYFLEVVGYSSTATGTYQLSSQEVIVAPLPEAGFDYQLVYTNALSFGSYFSQIDQGIQAALQYWGQFLFVDGSANLAVEINYTPQSGNALASAGPESFINTGTFHAGRPVHESNVQYELRTGRDITSGTDLVINIATSDLSLWWFDSTPLDRTDNQPGLSQIDFVGVMLHEFTHALGFLSLYDYPQSGVLQAPYGILSSFDPFIDYNSSKTEFFFTGLQANQAFQNMGGTGLLPIYAQPGQPGSSLSHYDDDPFTGSAVLDGLLMTPFVPAGRTLDISELDLAILEDMGYSTTRSGVAPAVQASARLAQDISPEMDMIAYWG